MPARYRKTISALWKVMIFVFMVALNILFIPDGRAAEAWKGNFPKSDHLFSASVGGYLFGTTRAFVPVFSYAYLVNPNGWIDDIDEVIYLEGQLAPAIFARPDGVADTVKKVGWMYSLHLRWEFHHDSEFSLYALGGFSGMFGPEFLGSVFTVHPRLGLGALYHMGDGVGLKGELSQDLATVGFQIGF